MLLRLRVLLFASCLLLLLCVSVAARLLVLLLCWSFFFFVAMGQMGLMTFVPTLMKEIYAFELEAAAAFVSVMIGAIMIGVLLGGYLADKLRKPDLIVTVGYCFATLMVTSIWYFELVSWLLLVFRGNRIYVWSCISVAGVAGSRGYSKGSEWKSLWLRLFRNGFWRRGNAGTVWLVCRYRGITLCISLCRYPLGSLDCNHAYDQFSDQTSTISRGTIAWKARSAPLRGVIYE